MSGKYLATRRVGYNLTVKGKTGLRTISLERKHDEVEKVNTLTRAKIEKTDGECTKEDIPHKSENGEPAEAKRQVRKIQTLDPNRPL